MCRPWKVYLQLQGVLNFLLWRTRWLWHLLLDRCHVTESVAGYHLKFWYTVLVWWVLLVKMELVVVIYNVLWIFWHCHLLEALLLLCWKHIQQKSGLVHSGWTLLSVSCHFLVWLAEQKHYQVHGYQVCLWQDYHTVGLYKSWLDIKVHFHHCLVLWRAWLVLM